MARSKNEIKSKSELPKWFNSSKYKAVSTFGATDWARQIHFRVELVSYISDLQLYDPCSECHDEDYVLGDICICCQEEIDYSNETWKKELYEKLKEEIEGKFEKIHECPIIDDSRDMESYMSLYLAGVRDMNMRDLLDIHKDVEDEFKYSRTYIDYLQMGSERENALKKMKKPNFNNNVQPTEYYGGQDIAIMTRLDYPDEVLISDFCTLIKKLRKERSVTVNEKKLRKEDFSKWCRYGLLQYLDLYIWSLLTDKTIPNRVLALAIFPDGCYDTDTIRKYTKVIANKFLEVKEIGNCHHRPLLDLLLRTAMNEKKRIEIV